MSENGNRRNCDFSIYDTMSTEELEEILRLDAEAPESEESDTELLLYVMGVLAKRRKNQTFGKTALEAYESFKRHYLPRDKKRTVRPVRWLRGLTAAAAVLAVIFCGTITARALGLDLWKVVVVWAQETFHLSIDGQGETDTPNPNRDREYESLEDALQKIEKASGLVPTWVPEKYVLNDIFINETPLQKVYIAVYKCGEANLKITVRSYITGFPEQIEQSDGFVEKYTPSEIDYFLFTNHDQAKAAWINGSYECYIAGELTIEELKTMIDSIGKG